MSKYPPNDYDEPYIGDPLPMGEARPLSEYEAGFQDGYETGKARIAELEAKLASYDAGVSDREKLVWEALNARIAALEAERDRLKARLIAPLSALSGE